MGHRSPLPPLRSARLLDQLRERIRYDHYSLKTETSYVHWARRFVHFHGCGTRRRPASTSAACRNCSATRMCRRR
jgi:hypothetical protein